MQETNITTKTQTTIITPTWKNCSELEIDTPGRQHHPYLWIYITTPFGNLSHSIEEIEIYYDSCLDNLKRFTRRIQNLSGYNNSTLLEGMHP